MGKVLEKRMRVDADGRLIVEGLTPNHEVDVTVEAVVPVEGSSERMDATEPFDDVVDWTKYHGKLIKYERPFAPMEEWGDEIEPKP